MPGFLVVVMGLEVLETLKIYLRDHYVRLEVILIVAVIAVCRQVIEIDFEHAGGCSSAVYLPSSYRLHSGTT